VRLAFCPERTIQGRALRELVELPQVIGGLDTESRQTAERFFGRFAARLMPVSSLETAEMVKLANNCHTDVIYSYGNEVALMAKEFGLDPLEVIDAANIHYPRPALAKPGFVGGACLTKDPYILFASFDSARCSPGLIRSARVLNEKMPREVAGHLLDLLKRTGKDLRDLNVLICGFAYKGIPETDDMRGAPIEPFLEAIHAEAPKLTGHDPIVRPEVIASYGVQPVSLEQGFSDADAVIFLNNHPKYAALDLASMIKSSPRLLVLYDCWRIFRNHPALLASNLRYAGIGYERP
jgi:UDP-N-acetyl-D-mannosaminuronic acid dehydrogenase